MGQPAVPAHLNKEATIYLHDALFEPPEMSNTDGEPLSFRRLHYSIVSPLANALVLVTRNVREFSRIDGLQVENWF